ncbi:MAG: hypothetical protein GFH27_549283n321 [Chloroflexi bacterium AL-W]|nr:hypothetical protein [Chloroflexi bacterium AL-N1]NOK64557.1 hypothetical protein [Chloroflexi bacterium AL-N10]NOK75799.1 hypothetical protein [Chloroflexi bacterium AL-N5]NOK80442.1 hypothetical protein [Chloroflexi bacterium AL-W]NOK86956.1 hypothetical protein [Chloroflexi bacterium AL-N15]
MTTHAVERPINWAALIETFLLGGAGAMLLTKALRGVLVFYIHPRYTILVVACGLILLLIAGVRMRGIFGRSPESIRHHYGRYMLLAIPILLGTVVPAQPLGANVLSSTTLGLNIAPSIDLLNDNNTHEWNLLQWSMALSVRGDQLDGRSADVVGFVLQDDQLERGEFFVARHVISCCTADSNGVGLPVVWSDDTALPDNTWIRVQGQIRETTINGEVRPAILATSVEVVEQPTNPYIYP